jgi:chromosome segregation ATPase
MLRDSTNLANARISDLDRGNIEQAQEREQLKSQIVDNENKFREIIKEQYEKRDNLENKILISIKHNEFLEQELFKYQNLLQNSQVELEERKVTLENKQAELEERKVTLENKQAELEESKATLENKQAELEESKKMLRNQEKEIKEISRELDKYRKSKFIRNCYFIENRIESVKGKCGKHSNRKLMKKDKDYWKPVFDSIEYCKYNPDIYHIIGNDEKALLKHFIYYGMNEGRIASCNFDIYAYCECNPDVKDLYGDNLKEIYLHYIEYGVNENRRSIW